MLARVTCQTNFETGTVSAAISDIQNIDKTAISSDSSKINTDLQTLTSDTNSGNREQVKTDLKTFRTDSKTTTMDLRAAIKNANPSSDQKTKLKSDMASLRATLKSCMFNAGQQLAKPELWHMTLEYKKFRTEPILCHQRSRYDSAQQTN